MCGSKQSAPPPPAVVQPVDPQVAADAAAAEATAKANTEGAARNIARRKSALATGAGMQSSSALSSGKATLGQ